MDDAGLDFVSRGGARRRSRHGAFEARSSRVLFRCSGQRLGVGIRRRALAAGGFGGRCLLGFEKVAGQRLGFAPHHILVTARRGGLAAASRHALHIVHGGALRALFLGNKRLSIGDRDLIVIGVNFAKREETVAVTAVIDERGLQRRLDARHLRQIDVAS